VPTPKAVLGRRGRRRPAKLPYAEEVYRYMRMLEKEKASPRVKVFPSARPKRRTRDDRGSPSLPKSLIAKMDENRAPAWQNWLIRRTINFDDVEADRLVNQSFPNLLHHGHDSLDRNGGRRQALMELAYRLTVDDSPYIKSIRDGMVTLITPVVES